MGVCYVRGATLRTAIALCGLVTVLGSPTSRPDATVPRANGWLGSSCAFTGGATLDFSTHSTQRRLGGLSEASSVMSHQTVSLRRSLGAYVSESGRSSSPRALARRVAPTAKLQRSDGGVCDSNSCYRQVSYFEDTYGALITGRPRGASARRAPMVVPRAPPAKARELERLAHPGKEGSVGARGKNPLPEEDED